MGKARAKKGEESRAAAVGRKRPQTHDPVSAYKPDKRQKLEDDDSGEEGFMPLNFQGDHADESENSKESGEVSASTKSSRRSSKTSEAPKRATRDSNKQAPVLSSTREFLRGIDVNALFPEKLQAHVREQMEATGWPAEIVLEDMKQPYRKFGKQAREFVNDWATGYYSTLRDYQYSELQHLVYDPNSLARPFDLDKYSTKKPFGKALQEVRERNPGIPARAVLFELTKNRTHHRKACEVLHDHLWKNPRTAVEQVPTAATQPANTTVRQSVQNGDDTPGDEAPEPIAPASPMSRTVSPHQSPSVSEGEVSESENDEDDTSDPSDDEDDDNDMYGYDKDGIVCLSDLSVEDQALQYRYFHLTDPGDSVHCLCCGERGHMQSHCPARTCQHCHQTTHFSRGCPSHQKCERCRERGHNSKKCTKRSKPAGAPGDECDICGERGHAEEECAGLWMTFKPDADSINKIPAEEMVVSCYNCGAKDHWGDDCKHLPDYVAKDIMHPTWSAKNASKYIIGAEEKVAGARNGVSGNGSVQAHQLAQLGDWM